MAVHVDDARIPFRGRLMCHMVADTLPELHALAARIGMPRRAFQPVSFPHYDLDQPRREAALAAGARPIGRRELALLMRRLRADPAFMAAARAAREEHDLFLR